MKQAQRQLVVKTLNVIGLIGIAVFLAVSVLALFQVVTTEYTLKSFIRELFSEEVLILVFWLPLVAGGCCLWLSAFVSAGADH
ncbi:TPA: hypothetical protein ACIR1J_000408 [Pseudomonas aeruginosa]|nr:hypothetical protein [Pseudomonas aeruginosa]HBO2932177.1 hypothetical protein [Pseudomonas aeruginosa]HCF0803867.1 hypothetical protein [Pseudomonas aeruginosa]